MCWMCVWMCDWSVGESGRTGRRPTTKTTQKGKKKRKKKARKKKKKAQGKKGRKDDCWRSCQPENQKQQHARHGLRSHFCMSSGLHEQERLQGRRLGNPTTQPEGRVLSLACENTHTQSLPLKANENHLFCNQVKRAPFVCDRQRC